MPEGSLDKEAKALLEEEPPVSGPGNMKIRGMVAWVARSYGTGRKPKSRDISRHKPTLLKQTVKEAEDYGAYVPVLTNGFLSAWHYDSGAGISQFNLEAAKELAPYLEKADWDEVDFISARDVSRVNMTLYRVKECCLMQMESGITSNVGGTLMVCNPELQTYDRLLGLNTMKALQLADQHSTDMVIDPLGRPFRKYSHRQLPRLLQSVGVWNRKHAPAPSRRTRKVKRAKQSEVEVEDITEGMMRAQESARMKAQEVGSTEVLRTLFEVSSPDAKGELKASTTPPKRMPPEKKISANTKPTVPIPRKTSPTQAKHPPDPLGWMKRNRGSKMKRTSGETLKHSTGRERDGQVEHGEEAAVDPEGSPYRGVWGTGSRPRPSRKPPWSPDPTPPWLKEPLVFRKQTLPESPVQIQPDFYREIRNKAVKRWSRPFHLHSMAGQTRCESSRENLVC